MLIGIGVFVAFFVVCVGLLVTLLTIHAKRSKVINFGKVKK